MLCNKCGIVVSTYGIVDKHVHCVPCFGLTAHLCVICNQWVSASHINEADSVCDVCSETHTLCDECETWCKNSNMSEIDSKMICEPCLDSEYTRCASCAGYTPNDNVTRINRRNYCETCRDDNFSFCASCEEWYDPNNDGYIVEDQNFCCSDCAQNAGYRCCDTCGDWDSEDNMYPSEDGWYCERHRPESDGIEEREPYKNHDSKVFTGEASIGFELEMSEFDPELYNEVPEEWGWHTDGSVASGWEILTPPLKFSKHHLHRAIMTTIEKKASVKKDCGTHMHVGCFKDQDHAFRFYCACTMVQHIFVHEINSRSRHTNGSYCAQEKVMNPTTSEEWKRGSRYRAVNPCSYTEHKTIEIRTHQGTLNWVKLNLWASFFNAMFTATLNPTFVPERCCAWHLHKQIGFTRTREWEKRRMALHNDPVVCRKGDWPKIDDTLLEKMQELSMFWENKNKWTEILTWMHMDERAVGFNLPLKVIRHIHTDHSDANIDEGAIIYAYKPNLADDKIHLYFTGGHQQYQFIYNSELVEVLANTEPCSPSLIGSSVYAPMNALTTTDEIIKFLQDRTRAERSANNEETIQLTF